MKVKSESEVVQSYLTLSDPMDCSLPGSAIHGILQARVLEWGAIAFSDVFCIFGFKLYRLPQFKKNESGRIILLKLVETLKGWNEINS